MSSLFFYPAVLAGLFWLWAPPPLALIGAWRCWKRRDQPAARFTLTLGATTTVFFMFYFYQAARFMAAPATLLGIFGAVAVAEWIDARQPSVSPAESGA